MSRFSPAGTENRAGLTSVSQDAIDAVFGPRLVFVHRPPHHLLLLFLFLTDAAEFRAHDAADGAHLKSDDNNSYSNGNVRDVLCDFG